MGSKVGNKFLGTSATKLNFRQQEQETQEDEATEYSLDTMPGQSTQPTPVPGSKKQAPPLIGLRTVDDSMMLGPRRKLARYEYEEGEIVEETGALLTGDGRTEELGRGSKADNVFNPMNVTITNSYYCDSQGRRLDSQGNLLESQVMSEYNMERDGVEYDEGPGASSGRGFDNMGGVAYSQEEFKSEEDRMQAMQDGQDFNEQVSFKIAFGF